MEVLLVIISFVLGAVLEGVRRNVAENRAFDAKMEDMGREFYGEAKDFERYVVQSGTTAEDWINSLSQKPKRGPGRPLGSKNKPKAGK